MWDDAVAGFGVRVRLTGTFVVVKGGRGARCACAEDTIAAVGKITPERARARAKIILGAIAHGHDPVNQKAARQM